MDQSNFEEICPVCGEIINWSIFIEFKGCCCKECFDIAWEIKKYNMTRYREKAISLGP